MNADKAKGFLVTIILSLLAGACATTRDSSPQDSIPAGSPTTTGSATPTITSTGTPLPTMQLVLATDTPWDNPVLWPTIQAAGVKSKIPDQGMSINCSSRCLSPNGKWVLFDKIYTVTRTDGIVRWDLTKFLDNYSDAFSGAATAAAGQYWRDHRDLCVYHWSVDGNLLYFQLCDTGQNYFSETLYALDLNSGKVSNTYINDGAAFSPSDRFVVYAEGSSVRVRDIASGYEDIYSMWPDFWCHYFTWSPNESQIAFTSARSYEELVSHENPMRHIVLIDLAKSTTNELLAFPEIYTDSWIGNSLIRLRVSPKTGLDYDAVYDLAAHQLYSVSTITPTP